MVCIHYIHFLIVFIALCIIVFTVSATHRTLDLLYLYNVSRHSTLFCSLLDFSHAWNGPQKAKTLWPLRAEQTPVAVTGVT